MRLTLAHLPTEDAPGLLARIKRSPRASEVSWLECAMDEGSYLLLTPTNELEEREAMIGYLRATITTPRYRSADPFFVRHIHLDGETGPEPPLSRG
jgi:hypothetical protein